MELAATVGVIALTQILATGGTLLVTSLNARRESSLRRASEKRSERDARREVYSEYFATAYLFWTSYSPDGSPRDSAASDSAYLKFKVAYANAVLLDDDDELGGSINRVMDLLSVLRRNGQSRESPGPSVTEALDVDIDRELNDFKSRATAAVAHE